MQFLILAFVFCLLAAMFFVLGFVAFPEPPMNYIFFAAAGAELMAALLFLKKGLTR